MSKINYSDMSKNHKPIYTTPAIVTDVEEGTKAQVVSEVETETTTTAEPEVTVTEPQDTQQEPETKSKVCGVVSGCVKLNVRKFPNQNSEVVRVIDAGEEITVDLDNSTNDWYKVQIYKAADLHGYCMKKFVTVKD